MTQKTPSHARVAQPRRYGARILDSHRHDPYEPRGKYPVSHCDACGAVYRSGRWHWADAPEGEIRTCPACKRIAEGMPAGYVTLQGSYVATHGGELVNLVQHEAEAERGLHPMHRIMDLESTPDTVRITTTDVHLPQRIGEALRRAHDGKLEITFSEDAYEIRVDWTR